MKMAIKRLKFQLHTLSADKKVNVIAFKDMLLLQPKNSALKIELNSASNLWC